MSAIRGLYAVVDPRFLPVAHSCLAAGDDALLQYVRNIVRGGCPIVQLRVKDVPDADQLRYGYARAITELKREYDFCFIVNDDLACAKEFCADGVHIGADDCSIAEARTIVGRDVLIGYSSHSVEEAQQAASAGADYVACGAVFSSATKGPGYPVLGLEKLQAVVNAVSVPVVAIGGLHRQNVHLAWETGVASVAMITGLSRADDPCVEAQWMVNALRQPLRAVGV